MTTGPTTTPPLLPFELAFRNGAWRGRWSAEQLFVRVSGTEAAPAPVLLETLRDIVARWPDVKTTIATFLRGLDSDHLVPLDPATRGGFAAGSCGFDQPLIFQSLAVESVDTPQRIVVTFYTGYPDGYASYAVTLEHGAPTTIGAFSS